MGKKNTNCKRRVKLSLFWYGTVYKENPKELIKKKILDVISEFSKILGYKVNIESIVYPEIYLGNKIGLKCENKCNLPYVYIIIYTGNPMEVETLTRIDKWV